MWFCRIAALLLLLSTFFSREALGYSVLTHEEIVDLAWKDSLVPNLLQRFRNLSEDDLREAHAYAYGGAVIQDLGYYPFGNKQFTNLTHYVRSGDFVVEMLKQSTNANEFAFAMGALAHYASDVSGHPAVNRAVALLYPKLRAKFGDSVTFADDKSAHLKTEFGFDVAQVAKNRYAAQSYHDFIGFKVSKPLLVRTFPIVYGQKLEDLMPQLDLALGTYRYGVSSFIPSLTKIAIELHKDDIPADRGTPAEKLLLYRLSRSEYEKEWGKDYSRPGFFTRFFSFLIRLIPRIGPFKRMTIRPPTPETEELYVRSVNATIDYYKSLLAQAQRSNFTLPDRDLDSGQQTRPHEYSLADETYDHLLLELERKKFESVSTALRQDLLNFYASGNSRNPPTSRKERSRRAKIDKALEALRSMR